MQIFFILSVLLLGSTAYARGQVFYGEYQLVQIGKSTITTSATLSITGGKKAKTVENVIACFKAVEY